jgi:uncharacterized protein YacL
MTLSTSQNLSQVHGFALTKSFLTWAFTLAICMIVVGFPLLIVVTTIASLLAMVLQSVMPMSAVLLVVGGLLVSHLVAVLVMAAVLTLRGIHPQDVSWLTWLSGTHDQPSESTFASCPLTCEIPAKG